MAVTERPGTIYMNQKDRDQMDALAKRLAKRGVRGLYKNDGELNRSALVRFLVDFTEKVLDR